ncbi:MAG: hypothetical protein HY606_07330 [Planctomycetes bacterium]|nr:hypothetical protein [Planctomycetota bacterium]
MRFNPELVQMLVALPIQTLLIGYFVWGSFWLWVAKWGGAEWVEEKVLDFFLISRILPRIGSDSIKFVGWTMLVVSTILFVICLSIGELSSVFRVYGRDN